MQINEALKQNIISVSPIEADGQTIPAEEVRQWLFLRLPTSVRRRLIDDKSVAEALGIGNSTQWIGDHPIALEEFVHFGAAAIAGQPRPLVDVNGFEMAAKGSLLEDGSVSFEHEGRTIKIDFAGLFNPDVKIREMELGKILSKQTFPISAVNNLKEAVEIGPLTAEHLADLFEAMAETPQAWVRKNRVKNELTFRDLSADGDLFYLPFADFKETQSLSDVFEKTLKSRLTFPGLGPAARMFAPLVISPDFPILDFAKALGADGALLLIRQLRTDGDPFSLIAAFQIACARLGDNEFRDEANAIFDKLGRVDIVDSQTA